MKHLWSLIFFVAATLPLSRAHGLDVVECWNESCLEQGWTLKSVDRAGYTDFQCRAGGCTNTGWIIGGTQGIENYVTCKAGGCFKEGWYEIHRWSQKLIRQVTCRQHDCLHFGWTTYEDSGYYETTCTKNDCKSEGWDTIRPGYKLESIICTQHNCFRWGWIVSTHL